MSYLQKEIKEALEKAEVGPWSKVEFANGHMEIWQSIDNTGIAKIWGNNETATANARLIANAPTWLSYLLSELEEANSMIEALKMDLEGSQQELEGSLERGMKRKYELEQKDAEITMLREIQRSLVLTPMQKMSRAMDIISQFNKKEGM